MSEQSSRSQIYTEVMMTKLESNIEDIRATTNKLEKQVMDIQKKIQQVVWIAIGAGGMLVISSLGLTDFLQRIIFGRI